MGTGRNWTRRSIEELIEERLKRIKLTPTVTPSGSGNLIVTRWDAFNDTYLIDRDVTQTDLKINGNYKDSRNGTDVSSDYQPVMSDGTITRTGVKCINISSGILTNQSSLSDLIRPTTAYETTMFLSNSIKNAFAFQTTNPFKIYRLHYNGDYDLRNNYSNINYPIDTNTEYVTIAGSSWGIPYMRYNPLARQSLYDIGTRLTTLLSTYYAVLFTNADLTDDQIIAFCKSTYQNGLFYNRTFNISDLDLS